MLEEARMSTLRDKQLAQAKETAEVVEPAAKKKSKKKKNND